MNLSFGWNIREHRNFSTLFVFGFTMILCVCMCVFLLFYMSFEFTRTFLIYFFEILCNALQVSEILFLALVSKILLSALELLQFQ